MIVDWDVHHGQGTQRTFYKDPRVLYFSMHRQVKQRIKVLKIKIFFRYEWGSWWPELRESDFDHIGEGEGEGFNVNVPLNVIGNGDSEYLFAFTQVRNNEISRNIFCLLNILSFYSS